MSTVEMLIDKGIEKSGKKIEEIVQMLGVSLPTFFRQRKGKSPNSYTEKDCMINLVKQGIVEPEALPTYCRERCLIGEAREEYKVKARRLNWWIKAYKKIKALVERAQEQIAS